MEKKNSFYVQIFSSPGLLLLAVTITSLIISNSPPGKNYVELFDKHLGFDYGFINLNESIVHWINNALMAVFFLYVGLEIKRELIIGELSSKSKAKLPFIAAAGGMLVPALIYISFNHNTNAAHGWGIPMATDIAFALAILSIAGRKIPHGLKIFLTALAIIDDLGAIIVIAFFYTSNLELNYLLIALIPIAVLFILNRTRNQYLPLYLVSGVVLWYCVLKSGIHATVSGVLLAMFIPLQQNKNNGNASALVRLEKMLHEPVNYFILPLFALANTALIINDDLISKLNGGISLGIICGLLIGKPVGITLFSRLAVRFKFAVLPSSVNWQHIIGASILGGIGFTMSIFISMLAFGSQEMQEMAKISVLIASCLSGITGFFIIRNIRAL